MEKSDLKRQSELAQKKKRKEKNALHIKCKSMKKLVLGLFIFVSGTILVNVLFNTVALIITTLNK